VRNAVRRLVVLVAGLLLAGGAAGYATAAPIQAQAVDYVALGDSYASGTGIGQYYSDSGSCKRSPQAYAALWASSHAVSSFTFVACSGATTQDVQNNQLSALNSGTDFVTISIGGNDVGFAEVVTTCQLGTDSLCDQAVSVAESVARNQLPGRLDAVYAQIRQRAPQAQVVVLGYPGLFEMGSCGITGMSETKRQRLNAAADVLASVISSRAQAAGFTYVDTRSAFVGHRVCASDPWINGLSWPVDESYHPNAKGHANAYLPALNAVTGFVAARH